jgi:hypothetical protein
MKLLIKSLNPYSPNGFHRFCVNVDKLHYLLYNNKFILTSLAINDKMFLQLNNKYKLKKGAFINAKIVIFRRK